MELRLFFQRHSRYGPISLSAPRRSLSALQPAILIAFIMSIVWTRPAWTQTDGATEYQVKAAYLYNFAKSAEWPERALPGAAPLMIGVVGGDDEFIDILKKTVAGRSAGTHPLSAKRAESIEEMGLCRLVFFRSSAGRKRTDASIPILAGAGVLLVGEDSGFLAQGGMINLVLKQGKVRFEIDQSSLDGAGIKLSPALLALISGTETSPSTADGSRRLKFTAPPEYPEIAQKMNIKGVVQVEASVRRDGTVKEVRVLGGHPMLADALVKAVMGWRYEPAATDSRVVVKFVFGQ